MSEKVSKEAFDTFCSSIYPKWFCDLAQKANEKGGLDNIKSFSTMEHTLRTAPMETRSMLEEMGIVENFPDDRIVVTPKMLADGVLEDPRNLIPKISDAGREVIMLCDNLYTPEELREANPAAQQELDDLIAAGDAEFGVNR